MIDTSYAKKLQNISAGYYNQLISREDYVSQRKEILDAIDSEYNGVNKSGSDDTDHSSALFMNTISFFKSKDTEK